MGELHTIGTKNLPIKVLLLNNYSTGMVCNIQTQRYGGRIFATEEACRTISYANIAHECGFHMAKRVDKRSELQSNLELLIESQGPSLLEVVTDTEEAVFPVIAPGKEYKKMALGPFISNFQ